MPLRVLFVGGTAVLPAALQRAVGREGHQVAAVPSGEEALSLLEGESYDLLVTEINLPGMDGLGFLRRARVANPGQYAVVVTAHPSLDTAVEAVRAGALDYLGAPVLHEELLRVVGKCQPAPTPMAPGVETTGPRGGDGFSAIMGESPALARVVEEARKIAPSRSSVLLLGETGTGKELFARAIHLASGRGSHPFAAINCSAIPEALLESELFGHARGAFTGAVASREGIFEASSGGTLFMDEIAELGPGLQAKLLRVLEDREVRPLGRTQSVRVDIRFVFATNRNLERRVAEGAFREDLFYRISVITLRLPPLRDRREDIPLLSEAFLRLFAGEMGKPVKRLSAEALEVLKRYDWPGNVRELRNIVERAVLLSDGDTVGPELLPEQIRATPSLADQSLKQMLPLEQYARRFILQYEHALKEADLAAALGISRKTLWDKRRRWGIPRKK